MILVHRSRQLLCCLSLAVLAVFLATSGVLAQDSTSDSQLQAELKLIIEPNQPSLQLDVWVDRQSGTPYQVGDSVTIYARANRNAYVYIFNVSPRGEVTALLPSSQESDNYVRAGQILRLPRGNYRITASTAGTEHLIAIATLSPINMNSYWIRRVLDSAQLGTPVTSTADEFLQRLTWAELQPFHYGAYTSTIISFVVEDPYYTRVGNLSVSSSPSGALVFVDGKQVGITPCTVRDLIEGYHELTLVKEGYRTIVDQVAVRARVTEYKSYTFTALGTQQPVERVVFGPWRLEIRRENDGATRTFAADMGYSGTIQVRPRESYDGKLYQIEGLFTVLPAGSVSQVFLLLADDVRESDRGTTITKTAGPFRILTTIENVELSERGSVFSSRYLKSITLSIQVVWTGSIR